MTNTNEDIKNRIEFLLKKEDLKRINIEEKNNKPEIMVDLHNLGTKDAKIFLSNIIALVNSEAVIKAIHGYNHGIAIKEMIQTRLNSSRILELQESNHNPGVTFIYMSARI